MKLYDTLLQPVEWVYRGYYLSFLEYHLTIDF